MLEFCIKKQEEAKAGLERRYGTIPSPRSGPTGEVDVGTALRLGDRAPDFTLEEAISGKSVALAESLGRKVVMVEFWATWSDVCKAEVPRLQSEYAQYKDKGYELLLVALSKGDSHAREKIQRIMSAANAAFPVLLDTEFSVATAKYKLTGPVPVKFIVDCRGAIRYIHAGDYNDGISEVPFVLDELLKDPSCSK